MGRAFLATRPFARRELLTRRVALVGPDADLVEQF
jgi:hypothetical protein